MRGEQGSTRRHRRPAHIALSFAAVASTVIVLTVTGPLPAGADVRSVVQRVSRHGGFEISDRNVSDDAVSGDGRFVAMSTTAQGPQDGLDPDDRNDDRDVYVRDNTTGLMTLISQFAEDGNGVADTEDDDSFDPVISADGRYVAFISAMPYNYSPDETEPQLHVDTHGLSLSGRQGVFLVDRGPADGDGNYPAQFCYETDDVQPCMADPSLVGITGAEGDTFADIGVFGGDPYELSMSADGLQLAFEIQTPTGDESPPQIAVAVADLDVDNDGVPVTELDTDFRLTVMSGFYATGIEGDDGFDPDFAQADVGDDQFRPAISADGTHVAFHWHDSDQHGDASLVSVYDRDIDGDRIRDENHSSGATRVSLVTSGAFTSQKLDGTSTPTPIDRGDPLLYTASGLASVSGDGLTVAYSFYYSQPDNGAESIVSDLPADVPQVVVVDRDPSSGALIPGSERVVSGAGPPGSRSYGTQPSVFPVLSDDGRYVAFDTAADIADVEFAQNTDGCPQDRHGFTFPDPQPVILAARQSLPSSCHVVVADLAQELDNNFSPKMVDSDGINPSDGIAQEPDISTTGRFVTFSSDATNLDTTERCCGSEPSDEQNDDVYELEWTPQLVATPDPTILPETPVGGSVVGPTKISVTTPDFGPFEIGDITLLGQHDQDFTVDSLACQGVTFHAGQPCEITVRFTPTEVGLREADVVVNRESLFFSSSLGAVVEVTGVGAIPQAVGQTERVSLGSPGNDFTDQIPQGARNPDISANGRFVTFETDTDLSPLDNNFATDIYVRDLVLGTTSLVSSRTDGTTGGGVTFLQNPGNPRQQPQAARAATGGSFSEGSFQPSISADGRYIVYESADRKTDEDGESSLTSSDIWMADRGQPDSFGGFSGPVTPHLVSVFSNGSSNVEHLDDDQVDPSISADGTQVAWTCVFLDFGCDGVDGGQFEDTVLVRDLDVDGDGVMEGGLDSRTIVVRPDDEAPQTNGESQARISADGDHIAFVADTVRAQSDSGSQSADVVWVLDRDLDGDGRRDEAGFDDDYTIVTTTQFTELTLSGSDRSVFSDPLLGTSSFDPAISGDGTSISYSFLFDDDNIGSQLPYDIAQVLVADRAVVNGAITSTEVVSASGPLDDIGFFEPDNCTQIPPPAPTVILTPPDPETCTNVGDGPSTESDISDDGRYVTFQTGAKNLHVDDNTVDPFGQCARNLGDSGDPNGATCDVLVVDRKAPGNAGAAQLVHPVVTGPGQPSLFPDGDSTAPAISGDGRLIVFQSDASNLIGTTNDGPPESGGEGCPCAIDDNFAPDVYLREWDPTSQANAVQLSFPSTGIGTTSAAQSVRVSTDQFGPDPILQAAVTGGNASDFVVTGSNNCLPPRDDGDPVAPVPDYAIVHLDTQCTISVAFRPTAFGTRSSTLVVQTGGSPFSLFQPQTMSIRLVGGGAGTGGFAVDPVAVDFGEQLVTVASPQQTVTVTNTGQGPLRINGVTITGLNAGDFTVVTTDCSGRVLQPGQSCRVTLVFQPTAPGESTAALSFDDDAAGNPHLVQLSGRAPVGTILVNPGVTQTGRTVSVLGDKWAPNSTVVLTMVDRINQSFTFPETLTVTTDANGRFLARILVFPRSETGPRLVEAQGQPATMTAADDLLVVLPSVDGPDFVIRG